MLRKKSEECILKPFCLEGTLVKIKVPVDHVHIVILPVCMSFDNVNNVYIFVTTCLFFTSTISTMSLDNEKFYLYHFRSSSTNTNIHTVFKR